MRFLTRIYGVVRWSQLATLAGSKSNAKSWRKNARTTRTFRSWRARPHRRRPSTVSWTILTMTSGPLEGTAIDFYCYNETNRSVAPSTGHFLQPRGIGHRTILEGEECSAYALSWPCSMQNSTSRKLCGCLYSFNITRLWQCIKGVVLRSD